MTDDDRDRRRLVDWLREEAESEGPPTYLEAVLGTTSHVPQLRSWRRSWARLSTQAEHLIRRRPRLALSVLAAFALASVLIIGATWRPQTFGEGSIAFTAEDGVYLIDADGSDARRIAEGVRLFRSAWSPDASRLLVRTERGGVRAIGADGRSEVDVVSGGDIDVRAVSWTPDGSSITFSAVDASSRDPVSRLFSVQADGTGFRPVEAISAGVDQAVPIEGDDPAWSPDGNWLAFTDRASRLSIVRADGSQRRQLSAALSGGTGTLRLFSWAPDSQRLIYQRLLPGTGVAGSVGIFVIGVDGKDGRRVSTDARVQVAPTWSPDGRQIAWFVESGDGFSIILLDVASEQTTELRTDAAFQGGWLTWSPDGSWLATYTTDLERLALVSVDRTATDLYVDTVAPISGVAWQP
jgi:Tol biopolymer transport system component